MKKLHYEHVSEEFVGITLVYRILHEDAFLGSSEMVPFWEGQGNYGASLFIGQRGVGEVSSTSRLFFRLSLNNSRRGNT